MQKLYRRSLYNELKMFERLSKKIYNNNIGTYLENLWPDFFVSYSS